jgi:hypothetical protein
VQLSPWSMLSLKWRTCAWSPVERTDSSGGGDAASSHGTGALLSLSLAGCHGSTCQTGSGKEVGDDGNFLMIRCSAF